MSPQLPATGTDAVILLPLIEIFTVFLHPPFAIPGNVMFARPAPIYSLSLDKVKVAFAVPDPLLTVAL